MLNLSQQDYVKRIEELNQALITAWDNDHRVKALKIAIQVRGQNSMIFLEIVSYDTTIARKIKVIKI